MDENDELLYDPIADGEDEKWVEEQRKEYIGLASRNDSQHSTTDSGAMKSTQSDAVLNCPGCMTVLCLDCQRHEVYKTQYRAMFSLNCKIDWSEKVTGKRGDCKKEKKEKSLASEPDIFFNVRCSVCNSQVAVYDEDEVFHFFNVLSSYS